LSSLVNYNFGDSEVALLLWWMMGVAVIIDKPSLPASEEAKFRTSQSTI